MPPGMRHALRARCLRQLRDGLQERIEELRKITVSEVGCPISMTAGPGLDLPVKWLGDYADYLEKFEWKIDAGVADVMGGKTQRYVLNMNDTLNGFESSPFYVRPFDVIYVKQSAW